MFEGKCRAGLVNRLPAIGLSTGVNEINKFIFRFWTMPEEDGFIDGGGCQRSCNKWIRECSSHMNSKRERRNSELNQRKFRARAHADQHNFGRAIETLGAG